MTKAAEHADLLSRLRTKYEGKDITEQVEDLMIEAAELISWQTKEVRHLARCLWERDKRIHVLEEALRDVLAETDETLKSADKALAVLNKGVKHE